MKIKSVVINLDAAPDRMARMLDLANKEGIVFERIAAVNGRDNNLQSYLAGYRKADVSQGVISDTDIACMLSHRKAWEQLIKSRDEWLAVFEDDIHLGKDVESLLETSWIPNGVNLIKLEVHNERGQLSLHPITNCGERKLHILGGSNLGTAGYIISRSCAVRLLQLTEQVELPVDSIMFDRRGPLMQEMLVHQIVPAVVIQEFVLARLENRNANIETMMVRPALDRRKKSIFRIIIRSLSSIKRKYKIWRVGLRKLGPAGPIPFA